METFSVLLGICAGNSPVTGEFPTQRPVTRSFDVFFLYLRLNKRLSKESRGWWFQTTLRPLWRHCNEPEWKGMIDYLINCSSPKKVAVKYVINIIELLQNISVTTFYGIKLWASIYININHKAVSVLYVTGYRNWPRYGLRWSGWYCHQAQHELCRPSRGRLRPRRPAQRVLCLMAVPPTTAQTV